MLAVVALAAAVWFGYGWGRALLVDRSAAETRDAALSGAMQAAVNLNSVDAADVDLSIENMRSSITGDALRNDLDATEEDIRARVAETGTSMSAEVLFGTLTELNTDDDLGKALVVLAVRTETPEYFATNKVPVLVSLRKDGDVWKAETIEPLASTEMESGPAPGAPAPAPGAETAPEGSGAPAPAGEAGP
ncbi:hypothetical protein [Rhodococcus sp. B50]|uniref:hypothetical protein n=1 Tax=Rhodococcus sp. B50 TaxID=2682847 RepID=UPI001BD1E798|nr:hypothetical protein [Rhodococcus sp. B50]